MILMTKMIEEEVEEDKAIYLSLSIILKRITVGEREKQCGLYQI